MSGTACPEQGGVYVHFPFCVRRCHYCDFTLTTSRNIPHDRYADAIIAELAARQRGPDALKSSTQSLYFGGGTPSLWQLAAVGRVVDAVANQPGLTDDSEVTIEANPSQVSKLWLNGVKAAGINRVSLGVQSFDDRQLAALGCNHTGDDARRALGLVAGADLHSFSADLLFGLPQQTRHGWRATLDEALGCQPPHLTLYNLTVEPATVLHKRVAAGFVTMPTDSHQLALMDDAQARLEAAGFARYEISAYARTGHVARHNSAYWTGAPYLGLGVGAHGFAPPKRWVNIKQVDAYLEKVLTRRELPEAQVELLEEATLEFERVMTGLRRLDVGVDLRASWPRFAPAVRAAVDQGLLTSEGTQIRLTPSGIHLMDSVLLSLLLGR